MINALVIALSCFCFFSFFGWIFLCSDNGSALITIMPIVFVTSCQLFLPILFVPSTFVIESISLIPNRGAFSLPLSNTIQEKFLKILLGKIIKWLKTTSAFDLFTQVKPASHL